MTDPTQRFSSRVENYARYRPSYPRQVLELLSDECGLTAASIIADIGSGTGIMTRLFLENGNQVFAVEPNREMRQEAEWNLASNAHFVSVDATAEATTLRAGSVDFVVAAQAFHWFDREKVRPEFVRILKPEGWVVLIWNDRRPDSTPFLADYEKLLREYTIDFAAVNHRQVDAEALRTFYAPDQCAMKTFPYQQTFDFEGVKGRLLSSSYSPEPGHPAYEVMLDRLREIFDSHQVGGQITMEYDTEVTCGHLHTL
jgi:SAM-dependent methyltransferase